MPFSFFKEIVLTRLAEKLYGGAMYIYIVERGAVSCEEQFCFGSDSGKPASVCHVPISVNNTIAIISNGNLP